MVCVWWGEGGGGVRVRPPGGAGGGGGNFTKQVSIGPSNWLRSEQYGCFTYYWNYISNILVGYIHWQIQWYAIILGKKTTIHQVTTMLVTSKNVLFPCRNHLLTTGADDSTLWLSPVHQRVCLYFMVKFLTISFFRDLFLYQVIDITEKYNSASEYNRPWNYLYPWRHVEMAACFLTALQWWCHFRVSHLELLEFARKRWRACDEMILTILQDNWWLLFVSCIYFVSQMISVLSIHTIHSDRLSTEINIAKVIIITQSTWHKHDKYTKTNLKYRCHIFIVSLDFCWYEWQNLHIWASLATIQFRVLLSHNKKWSKCSQYHAQLIIQAGKITKHRLKGKI